jgi:hypothetical protein
MDLLSPLRNYCERTGDHLYSEPVNAISNISFFIASWFLWKAYQSRGTQDKGALLLIVLIALVGFGSTLFHTFANGLTMLGDIIPIAAFTFCYLWLALRKLVGLGPKSALFCLFLFAAVTAQTGNMPADYRFNGSVDYFPCLGALLIISTELFRRNHFAAPPILLGAAIFVISLTLRSIDFAICPSVSVGSHFLWHLLNGCMLYLLTSVFLAGNTSVYKKSGHH